MTKMSEHREGFEDYELCCGHYDPDKAEERRCYNYRGGCNESDLTLDSDNPITTGRECFQAYLDKETRRHQAKMDAMTPKEREARERFLADLRALR